ncbi:hypothetical protein GCM10012287_07090 [Streptomyces daqingensis]|uniref:Uncharacterized protein n=1 Tax=Streptomyces daqingensis TaxID=1472640 RepID=A0ABQ2LVF8_9ACTN|nr:hypothetical protein GCM10012287_07090 [Streptomyces daqingensis]
MFADAESGYPDGMFRAIADALRMVGGAIATVVTLPFRLLAKLFGGASRTGRRV